MFPIILVSHTAESAQKYVQDFVALHTFSPHYVFEVRPLKSEITIDQVRAIKKEILTSSPHKRLIVFYDFDTAGLECQNALLKTLEEKNTSNQFILVAQYKDRILPTIQSRSQVVQVGESLAAHTFRPEVSELMNDVATLSNTAFLANPTVSPISREQLISLFDEIILYWRKKLQVGDSNAPAILKKGMQLKQLLLNNNLNAQLTIDSYLLFIHKLYKKQ